MGDDVEIKQHSVRLPGTLDQVANVRRLLATCLGKDHPCLDDARLLASEAATNALTHSASAADGGHFAVTVEWTPLWVMVSVADQGAATVPYRLSAQPYDISGRGVDLIDQVSQCWGFTRRRATETRVWFELSADTERTARTPRSDERRRTFAPLEDVLAAFATAPVLDAEKFREDIGDIADPDLFRREW